MKDNKGIKKKDDQHSGSAGFNFAEAIGDAGEAIAGAANAAGKASLDRAQAASGAMVNTAKAAGNAVGGVVEDVYVAFGGKTDKEIKGTLKREDGTYRVPSPMINNRELEKLADVSKQYEKMIEPSSIAKLGKKAGNALPPQLRDLLNDAKTSVEQQKYYMEALKVAATGFKAIEEHAVKMSVSDEYVLRELNKTLEEEKVSSIDEIRLLRSYDVSKVAGSQKLQHLWLALLEGAATGAPGFAGIPFNLVLSSFLFFRGVQSIAMFYGYDVKNDPEELEIAGQVFAEAIAPSEHGAGMAPSLIGKIMVAAEAEVVRTTVKQGWKAMASYGGTTLLIVQMRALSNAAAKKALQSVGQKGLEENVFANVFKQVGNKLGQKTIGKAIPYFGAIFGAAFDTGAMNKIIDFANLFYQKRFILEKEVRISALLEDTEVDAILDVKDVYVPDGEYEEFPTVINEPDINN